MIARLLVPAVLALVFAAEARAFRATTCETYDEFTYLRMGICVYRLGDFRSLASPMCPPLPILLGYAWPALGARSLPEGEAWEREVPELVRRARLESSTLFGVPLVLLVHGWLRRRKGGKVAAIGGGMVALSPSVVAAGSIATTDACFALFAVLALTALARWAGRPTPANFLLVGGALGLALGAKQTAAVLFPVALVELGIESAGQSWGGTRVDAFLGRAWRVTSRLAAWVALAFLIDWALYGFQLAPKFGNSGTSMDIPVVIPMVADLLPRGAGEAIMRAVRETGPPLALDTFVGQWNHSSRGHAAFLMGRYSHHGWWWFFPAALGIKSTPAELATFVLVALMACRPGTWRDPSRRLWLGTILVLLGVGMASAINIGHRYMLPVYPLAAMLAADGLGGLAARRPLRAGLVGASLLAWQAVSSAGIAPQYLGYFHSLCGGPSEGYRSLVDSNLDWGQDLPSLRRELEARGYRKVVVHYFGTAKPAAYGLRAADWLDVADPVAEGFDWVAISATNLQGPYDGSGRRFRRFRELPSVRVGYSIFLYDLKDPRVVEAYRADRAVLVEGPGPR